MPKIEINIETEKAELFKKNLQELASNFTAEEMEALNELFKNKGIRAMVNPKIKAKAKEIAKKNKNSKLSGLKYAKLG